MCNKKFYRVIPEDGGDVVVHVDDGDAVPVRVHGAEVTDAAEPGGQGEVLRERLRESMQVKFKFEPSKSKPAQWSRAQ